MDGGTVVTWYDATWSGESALGWAAVEAVRTGAELVVAGAHGVPGPREVEALRWGVSGQLPGLVVRTRWSRRTPIEHLVDLARDARLVVVGRRVEAGPARSLALDLLPRVACPVAVVPPVVGGSGPVLAVVGPQSVSPLHGRSPVLDRAIEHAAAHDAAVLVTADDVTEARHEVARASAAWRGGPEADRVSLAVAVEGLQARLALGPEVRAVVLGHLSGQPLDIADPGILGGLTVPLLLVPLTRHVLRGDPSRVSR